MASSRARREAAKIARGESHLPSSIRQRARQANLRYADRIMEGKENTPAKGSLEGKNLARLAALADQGKIDSKYLEFSEYWYHDWEYYHGS